MDALSSPNTALSDLQVLCFIDRRSSIIVEWRIWMRLCWFSGHCTYGNEVASGWPVRAAVQVSALRSCDPHFRANPQGIQKW
jgi:hypothetical protein